VTTFGSIGYRGVKLCITASNGYKRVPHHLPVARNFLDIFDYQNRIATSIETGAFACRERW
jgi:hypothetical protein